MTLTPLTSKEAIRPRLLPDGLIVENWTGKQLGMIMDRDLVDSILEAKLKGRALLAKLEPYLFKKNN